MLIIIGIIIAIMINYKKINNIILIGIGSIIAGGIGNLIDRIFRMYVIDFIDFSKIIDFPIFNIADICVVIGVFIIGFGYISSIRGEISEENNSRSR